MQGWNRREKRAPEAIAAACACALAVAACGQAPPATDQWLDIARTGEGGQVQYMPSSVRKNADGTTDVTVKVSYPDWQTWTVETKETVEQRTFMSERVALKFDCAAKTFAIVRREALDKDGKLKETLEPGTPAKDAFAPVAPGGIAAVAIPRACPGA